MAWTRRRVLTAVAAVAVLGGIVAYGVVREQKGRVDVQARAVAPADLTSVVSASGEVKPRRYVNVSSNVSGRITDLLVKEGDAVKAGQVLARIDSTRIEAVTRQSGAAVEAARADLRRAEADLEVARSSFERTRRMHADRLVSDQAFDEAEAGVKALAAVVEAARRRVSQYDAALESNRDDLAKTTVVAPMDGVVTSLQKEMGEMVIGAQSFQPTVIMTVADLSVMEVEILVDETDIRDVALGQEAEVRVDALEGVKIRGEVTEIGSSAIPRGGTAAVAATSTANQAKDFKVTVTLKAPPASLRPGLNATADVTTARKEKVLAVPIQAVVVRTLDKAGKVVNPGVATAEAGEPAAPVEGKGEEKEGVFVVDGKTVSFRPVETGIMGETEIEVTEGLKEGERIVTGSYKTLRTLKDGARVKVEAKKEKP